MGYWIVGACSQECDLYGKWHIYIFYALDEKAVTETLDAGHHDLFGKVIVLKKMSTGTTTRSVPLRTKLYNVSIKMWKD